MLDVIYLLALLALSPWLLWRAATTGRYRRDRSAKLLGAVAAPNPAGKPVAWFHAVSVGEVVLLGTLIPAFRLRHPDWLVVVSAATDTGLAEARKRFADLVVIAWPFDFSWSVKRALAAVNPSLIVLTESELWPNFLRAARRRGTPVVLVNARMSPRSFARLRRLGGLARRLLFDPITRFAVQDEDYATRFRQLGVIEEKVAVTGSIKFDGALHERDAPGAELGSERLRTLLGAGDASTRPVIWLAGSTHAPEEAIVLDAYRRLRQQFPELRLLLVPRHPDRFEEAARLVEASGLSFIRRSRLSSPLAAMPDVVLLDSVGELSAAWGLASVGFTGGSLDGKRGGQSMIEPAGHGVPCVFGPHVWNFRDAAKRLIEAGGAAMIADASGLEPAVAELIADPLLRQRMGTAARELVRRQQGATARTLDELDRAIGLKPTRHAA